MEIIQHIIDLLFAHDCVVVPGFGGFVCHAKPAWISDDKRTLYPPARIVSFNINLTANDGLLAHRLVVEEGSDQGEAQEQIANTVCEWKEKLEHKGRLELNGIGIIYRDRDGSTRFEPERGCNFMRSSTGLQPVRARLVEREAAAVVAVAQSGQDKEPVVRSLPKDAEPSGRWRKHLQWAAALLPFFLYLGLVISHNDLLQQGHHFTYGDLNPFAEVKCSVYKPVHHRFVVLQEQAVDSTSVLLAVNDNGYLCLSWAPSVSDHCTVVRLEEAGISEMETAAEFEATAPGKYHIIGGCFGIPGNAHRFVDRLKKLGYQSHIIDRSHNLTRVAVVSCSDAGEAKRQLAMVRRELQPDAWLLIK